MRGFEGPYTIHYTPEKRAKMRRAAKRARASHTWGRTITTRTYTPAEIAARIAFLERDKPAYKRSKRPRLG